MTVNLRQTRVPGDINSSTLYDVEIINHNPKKINVNKLDQYMLYLTLVLKEKLLITVDLRWRSRMIIIRIRENSKAKMDVVGRELGASE